LDVSSQNTFPEKGIPTLPPSKEVLPSLIHISCKRFTVVVFPFEPVSANMGEEVNHDANSISLTIGIF
jgi:hypothetical protein